MTSLLHQKVGIPKRGIIDYGSVAWFRPQADVANVTGDGVDYQYIWEEMLGSSDVSLTTPGSSGQITINTTGTYILSMSAYLSGPGGGNDYRIHLYQNGGAAPSVLMYYGSLTNLGMHITVPFRFNAGDTLLTRVFVAGTSKTYDVSSYASKYTKLMIKRISD